MTNEYKMTQSDSEPLARRGDGPSSPRARSRGRRILVFAVSFAVAAVFVAAGGLGISLLHQRAAAKPQASAPDPLPVSVVEVLQDPVHRVTDRFAGRVEAAERTDLAFEFDGRIVEIAFEEGDSVTAGTVVARLDTALIEDERRQLLADREALAARLAFARKTEKRRQALSDRGFSSQESFDEAISEVGELSARIRAVDAAVATLDTRLEKSFLRAPFAGEIAARGADLGAVLEGGVPVLTLLSSAARRVRVGLPPEVAAALAESEAFSVSFRGRAFEARIFALRPDIEARTRTQSLLLEFTGPEAPPIGALVEISVAREIRQPGYWIPREALVEGERGLWTVLTVVEGENGPVAGQETVQVLHALDQRVFVKGTLGDGQRVIATGAHRLSPGQAVRTRTAEAAN
jgi:RND family efflux transporter MFP subunit